MTIKDLLRDYLDARITAIDLIRRLSAIFSEDNATDLLVIINSICRIEQGDLDKETFMAVWKIT